MSMIVSKEQYIVIFDDAQVAEMCVYLYSFQAHSQALNNVKCLQ